MAHPIHTPLDRRRRQADLSADLGERQSCVFQQARNDSPIQVVKTQ
jgi:hypothetical protein